MMFPSMVITFDLSTYLSSSGISSLIMRLMEGVIGYSSLAAIIVTVVTMTGIKVVFEFSLTSILSPPFALFKNLSRILIATNHVSNR